MITKRIDAQSYIYNPRKISERQLADLEKTLTELGDLGSVVYNRSSGMLVGGNQRSKIINLSECDIEIIKEYDQPDHQGTVAIGFILWQGSRYFYREVEWDSETEKRANIVANKGGGEWDTDILKEYFSNEELLKWGFSEQELQNWKPIDFGSKNKEIDADDFEDKMIIKLEYTADEYEQVKTALHKIASTPEQAIWQLLGLENE